MILTQYFHFKLFFFSLILPNKKKSKMIVMLGFFLIYSSNKSD